MLTYGESPMAHQVDSRPFWSPGFGVVVDEFGVPWEINSVEPRASA
jgi:uncharacterized glyoxalase superfamily protein PhnB